MSGLASAGCLTSVFDASLVLMLKRICSSIQLNYLLQLMYMRDNKDVVNLSVSGETHLQRSDDQSALRTHSLERRKILLSLSSCL